MDLIFNENDDNLITLESMINNGLNVNEQDAYGNTLLYAAVRYKRINYVKLLLEFNTNPNILNKRGTNAFHLAICYGDIDVIKMLLDNGADVNVKYCGKWTVLHIACYFNNYNIVELLLDYNSDNNVLDNDGCRPIDLTTDSTIKQLIVNYDPLIIKEPDV